MRDRKITPESVIGDASFRHDISVRLVEGWFADRLGRDIKLLKTISPEIRLVIDTVVAVLDIPKADLTRRAESMDRSRRSHSVPLVTYYNTQLASARQHHSEDKARNHALSELASEMAERIVNTQLKKGSKSKKRAASTFAYNARSAVKALF